MPALRALGVCTESVGSSSYKLDVAARDTAGKCGVYENRKPLSLAQGNVAHRHIGMGARVNSGSTKLVCR